MARPIKNNADYFTHDSDMRNDVKIRALRRKFKHAGYAVWCFMLETLTDSDYFEIIWDEINIELLSADFDVSFEELSDIVDYCVKLGLFTVEDCKLFSPTHQSRFNSLLKKRERDKDYANAKNEVIVNDNDTETHKEIVIASDNEVIVNDNDIVKESKVEYSKEKDISRDEPLPLSSSGSLSEFITSFNEKRCSKFQAIEKVKKQFNARLKEGFTPAQMLQALENAMKDKYHIQEKYKYLTPEFFTRADKIEKFLNISNGEAKEGSIPAPKLGFDEYLRHDGTRTYGTGKTTVPLDAPPRPSASWWWNDGLKQWNM
jgi:hypothetical protein